MAENKIVLTEEEYNMAHLGSDVMQPYSEYLADMKSLECEYCGEAKAEFSIEVNWTNGKVEESNLVCPGCVATFYTETPEEVERMSVVRLEAI